MAKKKFDYPKTLADINQLVQRLQDEELSLEESYTLFKESSKMIQQCRDYLDKTELEVKQIVDGMEQDFAS